MQFLGLTPLDIGIVVAVMMGIVIVGAMLSRRTRHEADFLIGGRKLGGLLQFFLYFGMMADSNEAAIISTEVYRQGAAGMWIGFQALFATPFFWFSPIWFRRTRLITYGDLFRDRFGTQSLPVAYAIVQIIVLILTLALGNLISYKVASAMMVKPASAYTAMERQAISDFSAYQDLSAQAALGVIASADLERYRTLQSLADRGELPSYISYLQPAPFYCAYLAIIASYLLLGGLRTVARLDGLQTVLILLISFLLIPFGIAKLGGVGTLHRSLPTFMLHVFGRNGRSDYTWLSILAIVLNCILTIPAGGGPGNASGRNERAIRSGMLAAAFTKRLVMIAWMLCGMIAAAIFVKRLADPDHALGMLSSTLLPSGLLGLMIAGMLVGHMPNVGFVAVNISALFTKNIYEPLRPAQSEQHYLLVAKCAILGVLVATGLVALLYTGILSILTATLTFAAFFGAVGYLIYFWRTLTITAIWISMIVWIVMIGALPWALPQIAAFRRQPSLLAIAPAQSGAVEQPVLLDDAISAGPSRPNSSVAMVQGAPIFFEKIARIDPRNPASPSEGIGRFNIENYALYLLGVPLDRWQASSLIAARWLFDSVFPFVLLMGLSALTSRAENSADQQLRNDRFFAKLRTPIGKTAAEEEAAVRESYLMPQQRNRQKLFPRSAWEFNKWSSGDVAGFAGCWLIVLGILGVLWTVLRVT